jgi:hypothetical protein
LASNQSEAHTAIKAKNKQKRTDTFDDDQALNKGQQKNKWKNILKLVTWNVRGINFKDQLDDILAKK